MFAQENLTLHRRRFWHARQIEHRRRQINRREQTIIDAARFQMSGRGKALRPADDQRHQQTAVVTKLFATHVRLAVVTEEDDNGVVGESIGFQLAEDEPDLAVQFRG